MSYPIIVAAGEAGGDGTNAAHVSVVWLDRSAGTAGGGPDERRGRGREIARLLLTGLLASVHGVRGPLRQRCDECGSEGHGQWQPIQTAPGKQIHLSTSHSSNVIVAVSSTVPVGVDAESQSGFAKAAGELDRTQFPLPGGARADSEDVDRWIALEAALKMMGRGLDAADQIGWCHQVSTRVDAPHDVTVVEALAPGVRALVTMWRVADHGLAVAVPCAELHIEVMTHDETLELMRLSTTE